MHITFKLLACLILITSTSALMAHPVSYKDATGVMTWNQSFMSDYWITYSFSHKFAGAARLMRMEMPEGTLSYEGLQLDYLVLRENSIDSQANVYIYGGGGHVKFNDSQGTGSFVGFEADAESRKYFGLIKTEYMRSQIAPEFFHIEGRLGIAPYEAEYNEIASWLMLQLQWHPTLQKQLVITPLARFFYKSVLFEMGVSTQADWMLNFMFHF